MTDQLTADSARFEESDPDPEPGSAPQQPAGPASVDERLAERRRRWPALLAGVVVGCGVTAGILAVLGRDDSPANATDLAEVVNLKTVSVEQRDLIEEVDWSGTLAAGSVAVVATPAAGTVTSVLAVGDPIVRGGVVATVDDRPIVALVGPIPMWRDLGVGDEGADVLQMETNLVALGFDLDGDVTIDDTYTIATSAMVEAWQSSLGTDETGKVAMSDVVVVPGESTVTSVPAIGAVLPVGAELMTIETPAVQQDVVGRGHDGELLGTVDAVAVAGTAVEQGTALFTADGIDVVAVTEISPVTRAVLDSFAAGDISQIESVLVFLGFDPESNIQIDDEADFATVAAIIRWQESSGLPPTGSSSPGDYIELDDGRDYTVQQVGITVGDQLADGTPAMILSSPTLSLVADVAITQVDEFDVGDTVGVEQVDATTFTAVVTDIADVTTEANGGGDPTVVVTFATLTEPDEFLSGTVTITSESSRIDGATVVPTRALISLREGGFAVEKSSPDGSTTLIGVELGTFDDGVVEVTSGDLSPGDLVVVPS